MTNSVIFRKLFTIGVLFVTLSGCDDLSVIIHYDKSEISDLILSESLQVNDQISPMQGSYKRFCLLSPYAVPDFFTADEQSRAFGESFLMIWTERQDGGIIVKRLHSSLLHSFDEMYLCVSESQKIIVSEVLDKQIRVKVK